MAGITISICHSMGVDVDNYIYTYSVKCCGQWSTGYVVNFCTRFSRFVSGFQHITASITQGSAVSPVSFVINASDLSTVTPGNGMIKYADDTYIVIPACNIQSRVIELKRVAD